MVDLKFSGKQSRFVAAGMAALAGLMAVSLVYQGAMHLVWRSWLKEASAVLSVPTTQPAGSQPAGSQPAGSQPAGSQPASAPSDAGQGRAKELRPPKIAAAISRRNIFAPPRPTGHGLTLTGVIGRIALFNSRDGGVVGIQEGESEQGVKVVAIRDYEVTIEFKGKKETLKVFDSIGSGFDRGGPGLEASSAMATPRPAEGGPTIEPGQPRPGTEMRIRRVRAMRGSQAPQEIQLQVPVEVQGSQPG